MKDHRKWTAVITSCKEIPISPILIEAVKSLVREDKNVIIFLKKEDPLDFPKFTPQEKFKELAKIFNDELAISKIMISTIPDVENIIEMG